MDNTTGRKLIYSIRFRLILVISDIHSMPKGGISRCPIYNDNGSEIQDPGVHVDGGECPACDDRALEAGENRLDGDTRVHAGEVEDGVVDGGGAGIVRFNYDAEPLGVCGDKCGEGGNDRERSEILHLLDLQSLHQGVEALGDKPKGFPLNAHSLVDVVEE